MTALTDTAPAPLVRLPDWRTRLATYISACRRRPFAYGRFDCGLFAAGAVLAQTGTDFLCELDGRYTTELGAARFLRRNGLLDPADATARFLPAIPVAEARHGDLAAIGTERGAALVVVGGPHLLAAADGPGLRVLPLTDAFTAFKV